MFSRRSFLSSAAALPVLGAPSKVLIDTHIHLFAADQKAFPFHKNAPYKPAPSTLEDYKKFVNASNLSGAVIVHPEPYQDDHSYLEYCFANEPRKDFFRGTVLFDPLNPQTPQKIQQLQQKWPGRIKALRIHRMANPSLPPTTMGAIKDRDLESEALRKTVASLAGLKMMLQMHAIPAYAGQVARLAEEAHETTVILDHLFRAGQGSRDQWEAVLRISRRTNVVLKVSGFDYSSKQPWPHLDVKPYLKEAYDAFGPGRLIWGGLGMNLAEFKKAQEQFDLLFDFASESSKDLIRGLNAQRLYGWTS